jgi:hypothetical protein
MTVCQSASSRRTDGNAKPAASAIFFVKKDFGLSSLGFRILTPKAFKGASFEEYGRTNTGAIVNRISLNIEDNSALFFARVHNQLDAVQSVNRETS